MSQVLPDDLVWEVEADAAHLSELALTAIADGEEAILPASAMTHVETCEACGRKLGEAAMLSSAIGAALRGASTATAMSTEAATATATATKTPISNRPRARLPLGAIAAGLALALFGAIPMLLNLPSLFADVRFFAFRGLPVLFRGGVSVARSGVFDRTASTLTIASAFVLIVTSFLLLRRSGSLRSGRIVTQGVS